MTVMFEPMTEWSDRQFVTTVYLHARFGYFQYVRFLDLRGHGHMTYTLAAAIWFRSSNVPRMQ